MIKPAPLQHGDLVALAATARKVTPDEVTPFVQMLEQQGLRVLVPEGLFAADGQMAGTDGHRAALLQGLVDNEQVRAIFCARGGYGTVRIIDRLDFSNFKRSPKWLVGYSDVTALHAHLNSLGYCTLHATMPIDVTGVDCFGQTAAATMFEALRGVPRPCVAEAHPLNRAGVAEAELVGGNLSVLYSIAGSVSMPSTKGKILFIEDLDEYLYHIDRMMVALRRSGLLNGLAGLVVGGLTSMHDNTVPFGLSAEEIVLRAVADYDYPVMFGAPCGHLSTANHALPMGMKMRLEVAHNDKNCLRVL